MEVSTAVSAGEPASPPLQEDNPSGKALIHVFDDDKLKETITGGILEFDDWILLISQIESSFPDDIRKLSLVYDAFLSEFPLCHGYWKKYACHKMRLCSVEKVVQVFEQAVQVATYSVAVWVDYCTFGVAVFEDPNDVCRLFERGLSFVGKDYSCHSLWDRYIEFLSVREQWSSLAHIYLRTLRYPSKKLNLYYESFQKLVASLKEEIGCRIDVNGGDYISEPTVGGKVPGRHTDDEISSVVKDLLAPSTGLAVSKPLQAYLTIGEQFYQEAHGLMKKIHGFETQIRRPYFHVKPLDTIQLDNWHEYLNFAETCGDFDWGVKLYERCLISCANYPEFWIRYVDFVESKGGREIANFALTRATHTFLKNVSVVHLLNARFKEQIGDVSSACAALSQCGKETSSGFVENLVKKANMERRMGDFKAAANTFREAIEKISAGKENLETLPMLYVHFSRLNFVMTNSADSTREILMDGTEKVPQCKLLFEELIRFSMLHGGPKDVDVLDSIIAKAISPGSDSLNGLTAEDKEDISNLCMECIDLRGTIHDVRKAWNRHIRLFPHSVRVKPYMCPAASKKPLIRFIQRRHKIVVGSTQELTTEPDANQSKDVATDHVNCGVRSDNLNSGPNSSSVASGLEAPGERVSQRENHGESQVDLKGLSLGRLSLSSKDEGDEHPSKDAPVNKRAHFSINPAGARESDAIEIQPSGSQSSSSSPIHQRGLSSEPVQDQDSVRHSSQRLHRRSHANRDFKRGSHERPLQRQTQSYSPAEADLGVTGQAQNQNLTFAPYTDQAVLQASVVQNLQNQCPLSVSQQQLPFQPAVAYPQAQMPQITMQSNDQQGQVQNNEAYNQMWQHYYYYYYHHNQQQQLLTQQPCPNQSSQQQQLPNQSSPQLLPEQYQQQLLQLHQFFQQQPSQTSQQLQAESHQPLSQPVEHHTKQQSPIQQSQEPQNQQQQHWFLQQQQQQWFLQQQQYWQSQQPQQPQQQRMGQQAYPQQQSSYGQQQQFLLYLYHQQYQQYQQQQQLSQPQGEERHEENKISVLMSDGGNQEGQEYKVATAAVTSGGNASALSLPPSQSPGGV